MSMTDDFFRNRPDQMIDLRYPLAVLANRMPWQEIEACLAQHFARQFRTGKKIEDMERFGPTVAVAGAGFSSARRPRLPRRLMVSVLYLKHAFNESDEDVVQRWVETPSWQYVSGKEYFEHRWLCDSTQLVNFSKLIGEEGVEEMLDRTVELAVTLKLIAKKELCRIIVDSTVQEKAIARPTDSNLLETARVKLVELAKSEDIALKQTYTKEGQRLGYKAERYVHTRQFKGMRKVIKRQRTVFGRPQREVQRKLSTMTVAVGESITETLNKPQRLIIQTKIHKTNNRAPKLYSSHASEVECISKGKSRNPYEFGVKVGVVTALKGNLIVGARSFAGNPYDGHMLNEQVEHGSILMQRSDVAPQKAYADLGYLGVDKDKTDISIKHRGKFKSLTDEEKKLLKRRQAMGPSLGTSMQTTELIAAISKGQTVMRCTRFCAQRVTTFDGC